MAPGIAKVFRLTRMGCFADDHIAVHGEFAKAAAECKTRHSSDKRVLVKRIRSQRANWSRSSISVFRPSGL